jgi:putative phage-type endonuclease
MEEELSENSSITSSCFYSMFENISEQEYNDMLENIEDLFNIYIQEYGINMKNSNFMDKCIHNISIEIYNLWLSANICNSSNLDDIHHIVEDLSYKLTNLNNIPSYVSLQDTYIESNINDDIIEYIKSKPQPEQKSKEWYNLRQQIISASVMWKVFKSDATLKSLIAEKTKPKNYNISSPTMDWGNKYEPVSVMIYQDKYQTIIEEFGCIIHDDYEYIGASPDGINVKKDSPLYGRMLEIKNIVNRDITGIPKEEYWVQTQIQMETCNLDYCDFLETRFTEYTEFEFYNDTIHEYRGVILHFSKNITNNINYIEINKPHYEYYPINKCLDYNDINNWISDIKDKLNDTYTLCATNYWFLDELSCVLIKRNKQWFSFALPLIKNCFDSIQKEKNKSKLIIDVNSINGTHTIRNMPSINKINIVKT